jgi:dTDP-4-dehydrorhamnose 3,5-epimerase
MTLHPTGFEGLLLIEPKIFKDERGLFFESFNEKLFFDKTGLNLHFVQDNHSVSDKNVLRGMHLQLPPYEQGKLVRVVNGSVLDVVVDLRKQSKTYGKHYKQILSAKDSYLLWIPPGFAHGFLSLENNSVFLYKCTQYYHKPSEISICWNDPELNIHWNIKNPLLSEKDKTCMFFKDFSSPF